jgi:hypothetical protein
VRTREEIARELDYLAEQNYPLAQQAYVMQSAILGVLLDIRDELVLARSYEWLKSVNSQHKKRG